MIPNRIRAAVSTRDEWTCQRCGKHAGVIGASIHHRKGRQPYDGFDPNSLSNLVTLCGSGTTGCHGWVTEHPAEAYATGWAVRRLGNDHPDEVPMQRLDGTWLLLEDDGHRIEMRTIA